MEPMHFSRGSFHARRPDTEREALKRELDAVIANGLAQADAGELHDIDDLFAELQNEIDADDAPTYPGPGR